jgi:hypothetical protein
VDTVDGARPIFGGDLTDTQSRAAQIGDVDPLILRQISI